VRKLFLRSFAIAVVGFTVFFAIELYLELRAAGFPGWADVSWENANHAKLVDIMSPIARAYNNVLAILLATIGLAIPLTANMHTPKLIEIFLKDRINRFVLTYVAFGAAHALWTAYMIGPHFAPLVAVGVSVTGAILGWALVIPYFFYVMRFLDPSRMLVKLREATTTIVEQCADRACDPEDGQREILVRAGQMGTLIIKSLDRNDRDVAAEGAWSLKLMLDHYAARKARMPKEWFVVDRADFIGFSDDALDMLSGSRTWFEMKCLMQLELGFLRALKGVDDTISVFSDATRVIAVRAHEHHDEPALRLCIRFFNNYLRESIKSRHLRSVYDVYHQYRKLARELVDRPELLREIGRHFAYYAQMARTYGMVFAPQLAVFDLGYVTRRAYERASPAAPDLLREVLALPHRSGNDVHTMAVKAKLILGGFFLEINHEAEAELVRKNLRDIDGPSVERAETELLAADRAFFEVTDRQLNLEYIPPDRRDPLHRFCQSLASQTPYRA
jgi:hypothetical protein